MTVDSWCEIFYFRRIKVFSLKEFNLYTQLKMVKAKGLPVVEKGEEEEEEEEDVDDDTYQPTGDTDSDTDVADEDYDDIVDVEQSASNECQRASNGSRSDLLAGIKSQLGLGMSKEEMMMLKNRGVPHAENSFLYTRGYSSLSYLFMLFVFMLFMLFIHVNI